MLEIKNLTKIYKTKGGVDTKALDNVSVDFPEKGMVFLLGKSGSGKSTLLNLCGGLDTPTSGEIIVRGRSSATFSGSDFDSYRNTFIGFIFQEYNVLNEFTVEENLSIALELQGKPKDKEKVAELLRQVDMEGYAKRKPNTLSGGQKQRIAIARALIKDPRIIMADEPTGALDSATGKQVFDTLRSLADERLVIVVSHDREFAEYYGDRIIELKDGKIISDLTKERAAGDKISENVSIIGGNTLSVRNGEKLTHEDYDKIRDFLAGAKDEIIISREQKGVENFKKVNHIGADGSSEYFSETDGDKIELKEYTKADGRFVKSRLPLGKAVKMGVSGLKVKPFRLFFTILLSVAAFMMFGVSSTLMNYNENNVVAESFSKSPYNAVAVSKNYRFKRIVYENGTESYSYENDSSTFMTEKDVAYLGSAISADILPYYNFSLGYGYAAQVGNVTSRKNTPKTLADAGVSGFVSAEKAGKVVTITAGELPENNGETAISAFFAKSVLASDIFALNEEGNITGNALSLNSVNDLIGKNLSVRINGVNFILKITGIFDGGAVPAEFDGYDRVETVETWDNTQYMKFSQYVMETLQKILLVSDDFYAYAAEKTGFDYSGENDYNKYFKNGRAFMLKNDNAEYYFYSYAPYSSSENKLDVYFISDGKSDITGDEIAVEISSMPYVTLTEENLQRWQTEHLEYSQRSADEYAAADEYAEYSTDAEKRLYYYHLGLANIYGTVASSPENMVWTLKGAISGYKYEEFAPVYSSAEKQEFIALLVEYFRSYYPESALDVELKNQESGDFLNATIVGFYLDPSDMYSSYAVGIYVSEENYPMFEYDGGWSEETVTKYSLEDADVYYTGVFVPYGEGEKDNMAKILSATNSLADDDSYYVINNSLYDSINLISQMVDSMNKVFLYVGIALALFASLLLYNFISVSINSKMHEIGVLRAVGARGADVFKIFFSESFVISLICIVISLGGTLLLLSYLNAEITEALTFPMQLLVFGPLSLLMLVGVALLVALLGTFIPVAKISAKKPVDSMKAL